MTFSWSGKNSPGSINHLLHYWILARLLIITLSMHPIRTVLCRIHRRHWLGLLNERRRTEHRPQNLRAKKQHRDDWPMTSWTYENTDKSQLLWQHDHEPIQMIKSTKNNSFIVVKALSVTLKKWIKQNYQACNPSPPNSFTGSSLAPHSKTCCRVPDKGLPYLP